MPLHKEDNSLNKPACIASDLQIIEISITHNYLIVTTSVKLSIALVTFNRPLSLERTLRSLSKQNPRPHEIVISDDSNSRAAITANKELAMRFSCKYIKGPGNGLYANRNFVARHCSGTHIRTMDDDHEFPPDHLAECIKAIEEEGSVIWTIGEYFPNDKVRLLPPPIPGQLHPRGYSYSPGDIKNYFGISCGASIYPRTVVDRNILNIESYRFGIVYLEYGARLYKTGYVIKPLNTTYIIHHYDENNRSESSIEIIRSAEIFSMLMLSFHHFKNFKNRFLTVAEIVKKYLFYNYSYEIIRSAYLQFKFESSIISGAS